MYLKCATVRFAIEHLTRNFEARPRIPPRASQQASLARSGPRPRQHARPHERDRREHHATTCNGGERRLDVANARKQDASANDVVRHDRERPDMQDHAHVLRFRVQR